MNVWPISKRCRPAPPRPSVRPRLEALESRTVFAVGVSPGAALAPVGPALTGLISTSPTQTAPQQGPLVNSTTLTGGPQSTSPTPVITPGTTGVTNLTGTGSSQTQTAQLLALQSNPALIQAGSPAGTPSTANPASFVISGPLSTAQPGAATPGVAGYALSGTINPTSSTAAADAAFNLGFRALNVGAYLTGNVQQAMRASAGPWGDPNQVEAQLQAGLSPVSNLINSTGQPMRFSVERSGGGGGDNYFPLGPQAPVPTPPPPPVRPISGAPGGGGAASGVAPAFDSATPPEEQPAVPDGSGAAVGDG